VQFHQASVAASGLQPNSQDFGYSLGVLHHVPNTAAAIRSCTELLKPGAPLLLYLYYAFDIPSPLVPLALAPLHRRPPADPPPAAPSPAWS
jgi:SAM-dependent methyltransferase